MTLLRNDNSLFSLDLAIGDVTANYEDNFFSVAAISQFRRVKMIVVGGDVQIVLNPKSSLADADVDNATLNLLDGDILDFEDLSFSKVAVRGSASARVRIFGYQ